MDDRNARAAAARQGSPYLNTPQAAHFLVCSQRTLERMRTEGVGPNYRKHGRHVRYLIDDLESWSSANAQVPAATNDTGQHPRGHIVSAEKV
jgi:hypothetical protein